MSKSQDRPELNPTPDVRWWISWDKEKHWLHWFFGNINDCRGHPVTFVGLQRYAIKNHVVSQAMIGWHEWSELMSVRDATPQSLPRPLQDFSDRFFLTVAQGVIFFDRAAEE
jgi:hypothetical protein